MPDATASIPFSTLPPRGDPSQMFVLPRFINGADLYRALPDIRSILSSHPLQGMSVHLIVSGGEE